MLGRKINQGNHGSGKVSLATFSGKVIFEQGHIGCKGMSHANLWEKTSFLERGNSQCKGLRQKKCVAYLSKSKEANVATVYPRKGQE